MTVPEYFERKYSRGLRRFAGILVATGDVRYRIPEPAGLKDLFTTTQDHAVVALISHVPAAQIYYTLDGSEPSDESTLYRAPLQIALRPEKPELLKLVVVTPHGRRSVVYDATFLRRAYLPPKSADAQPKLAFVLFEGKFASVRDIARGTKVSTGISDSLDPGQFGRSVNYAVQFDGFLNVEADDFYQFVVNSDDGAVLEIDDEVVVDNDGNHAPRTIAGHIPLRRGLHRFRLRYFQSEGGSSLDISWAGSSGPMRPIEGSALYRQTTVVSGPARPRAP